MYNKIIFYNHFGNGDIFESREFVREICKNIPALAYIYKHSKGSKALRDIPELSYEYLKTPDVYCDSMKAVQEIDNCLYINTWIGRDGKYVLPGIGCTVEKLYEMYNDMLVGKYSLQGRPLDYIPSINYDFYDISKINDFISRTNGKNYIFISNGPVGSSQAVNFSFTPAILRLAGEHTNSEFLITEPIGELPSNVTDANTLCVDDGQTNLPELSYLSTFCNISIGRNSGPHVFSWVKANCFEPNITTITFTNNIECAHFVYSEKIPMRVLWSPATEENEVAEILSELLKGI